MLFEEKDLQAYALPLGEEVKEKCLFILEEVAQAFIKRGFKLKKAGARDRLEAYRLELERAQGEEIVLLPLGSYGKDTRGDKREVLELGVLCNKPLEELGVYLSQALMGGLTEKEPGMGSIFLDEGPAAATIIRYGYADVETGGTFLVGKNGKQLYFPEQERQQSNAKHRATDYSYKKLVRLVKKLRELMLEQLVAQQVDPERLEQLLLALEQQEFCRYDTLALKLSYCCLRLSVILEQAPEHLKGIDGRPVLTSKAEADLYSTFFTKLNSFCEIKEG